jgi:hypothetical protein
MAKEKNLFQLKVDEEFRRFVPPLSPEERKQLEKNIIQDGCRDALCVWNKTIIDGHNRYEICTERQIPFAITCIGLRSREEAIAWICANQLGRRNITDETRRYLIGKRYEMERVIGAHNASGINQHTHKEVGAKMLPEPLYDNTAYRTRERIGREYGVSHATVAKYRTYAEAIDALSKAAPELYDKIMSGQLKITQENIIKLSRLSPSEIQRIGAELQQNPNAYISYADTRDILPQEDDGPESPQIQIGAIKEMPVYDPDAEILSLTLTIPSWISSINRVRASAKLAGVSDNARKKLTAALSELRSVAGIMLSAIEEDN